MANVSAKLVRAPSQIGATGIAAATVEPSRAGSATETNDFKTDCNSRAMGTTSQGLSGVPSAFRPLVKCAISLSARSFASRRTDP